MASGAAVAALVAALAGCTFVTPQASLKHYDASDGVSAIMGDVHVANALLVGDEGVDGLNLVFTGINNGTDDVTLSVQAEGDDATVDGSVDLVPGSTHVGSGEDGQFLLPGVTAMPGSLVKVYFQYGDTPGRELLVPVFDATWIEYEGLLPTPTPTPTPTDTAAPEEQQTEG